MVAYPDVHHSKEVFKMAKVSGPLFSVEASGAYAGVIVFGKWKGRPVARKLVIPSNPQSAGQEAARNAVRTAGAAQKWVNANTQINSGMTLDDKAEIKVVTPGGYAWNGHLVDSMIGKGAVNMTASDAIFAGLSGPEQAAWDSAAAALNSLMPAVAQTVAGGGSGTPKSAGNVFLNYTYGIFVMGLVSIPGAVPPTYV